MIKGISYNQLMLLSRFLYIEKLVQAGILGETTGSGRNRILRAEEILSAIEGMEKQ